MNQDRHVGEESEADTLNRGRLGGLFRLILTTSMVVALLPAAPSGSQRLINVTATAASRFISGRRQGVLPARPFMP